MAVAPEVLVISGSMGAGKTTLMGEASDVLTAADIRHAAIELDTLGLGHLPNGSDNLQARNLAAMWSNFSDLGISRLLLSGAIESESRRDEVRSAIPGARIMICRLRASIPTMQARIRVREPGMLQEEFVARVHTLENALDVSGLADFSIDNENRSITEVARELLRRAGWLQLS